MLMAMATFSANSTTLSSLATLTPVLRRGLRRFNNAVWHTWPWSRACSIRPALLGTQQSISSVQRTISPFHKHHSLLRRRSSSSPSSSSPTSHSPQAKLEISNLSPTASIATLAISNPIKLNALTTPLLDSIRSSIASLTQNPPPHLRALILTGAPLSPSQTTNPPASARHSFIGGADIKELSAFSTPASARAFISLLHETCASLRHLPVPVLARIHGFCLGAGLELAASCDLRIATRDSVFGMPEVRVGIPSVIEAALLPGLIGWGRTRRLVYLGERIGAPKAEEWGLVERVVEVERELDNEVREWVDLICEAGPAAMKAQKTLVREWERCMGVDKAVEAGIEAFERAYADVEGRRDISERMGRFLERKKSSRSVSETSEDDGRRRE